MREEKFEVAEALLRPDWNTGYGTFASILHLVIYKLQPSHLMSIIEYNDVNVIDPIKGETPLHQLISVWTKNSCAA